MVVHVCCWMITLIYFSVLAHLFVRVERYEAGLANNGHERHLTSQKTEPHHYYISHNIPTPLYYAQSDLSRQHCCLWKYGSWHITIKPLKRPRQYCCPCRWKCCCWHVTISPLKGPIPKPKFSQATLRDCCPCIWKCCCFKNNHTSERPKLKSLIFLDNTAALNYETILPRKAPIPTAA